jgi:uncharacterized protein
MKQLRSDEIKKPRKRRLQKKLRVGEFQEFGFEIEIGLSHDATITFDDALDAWVDFVESRGWAFGGGGDINKRKLDGFVAKNGRGTLMEEDRLLAEDWLSERTWVKQFHVGQIKDAWHGW